MNCGRLVRLYCLTALLLASAVAVADEHRESTFTPFEIGDIIKVDNFNSTLHYSFIIL